MKSKFQYGYYRDNLRSNPDYKPYEPKPNNFKYYYVLATKDDDKLYLNRNGNLVKKSEATPFDYESAHKIVSAMKADPNYNRFAITSFGTDHALSGFITLCEQVPPIFVRNDKTSTNHRINTVSIEASTVKPNAVEHDLKDTPSNRDQTVNPMPIEPGTIKSHAPEINSDAFTPNRQLDPALPARRAQEPRDNSDRKKVDYNESHSNKALFFIIFAFLACFAVALILVLT